MKHHTFQQNESKKCGPVLFPYTYFQSNAHRTDSSRMISYLNLNLYVIEIKMRNLMNSCGKNTKLPSARVAEHRTPNTLHRLIQYYSTFKLTAIDSTALVKPTAFK